MRKRILAALLCACLLVPALTAPAFAAFPDVPADEWYTEYVDFCTEKGIVNGFEDGTFRRRAICAGASSSKCSPRAHR